MAFVLALVIVGPGGRAPVLPIAAASPAALAAPGAAVVLIGWLIFVAIILFLIGALVGVIQRKVGVTSD